MLMRLARQTYVRQYGEYTYLFGKVTAFDQIFRNAEVFFKFLTREPQEEETILSKVLGVYAGSDEAEIRADFDSFMKPLIRENVVLAGETAEELDGQEPCFTYDCENPKTLENKTVYYNFPNV